jgi:hypothetical protein
VLILYFLNGSMQLAQHFSGASAKTRKNNRHALYHSFINLSSSSLLKNGSIPIRLPFFCMGVTLEILSIFRYRRY